MGCKKQDHIASFLSNGSFRHADPFQILLDSLHQFRPKFPMGVLPSPESNRNLDFVATLKKILCVAHQEVIVVIARLWPHLDLFELRTMGLILTNLLALFVSVLAVIQDSTDRRA